MKNFILKFTFLSCLAVSSVSCTNDAYLKDADQAAAQENNTFTFEEGISRYIIDGKIVSDRAVIVKAASNAWSVHYDEMRNNVVISTTVGAYNEFQNTDIEFKKFIDVPVVASAVDSEIVENEEDLILEKGTTASMSRVAPPASGKPTGKFIVHDFNIVTNVDQDHKDIVLHIQEFPRSGDYTSGMYTNLDISNYHDTSLKDWNITQVRSGSSIPQRGIAGMTVRKALMRASAGHTSLINHSDEKRLITFYQYTHRKGQVRSLVINSNTRSRMRDFEHLFLFNGVPAGSIKISVL